jgi:hypothetical protein
MQFLLSWNVWLPVLQALLTFGLAYLGFRVTLHPTTSPERRRRYKLGFAFLTALAMISIIGTGIRSERVRVRAERTQETLRSEIASVRSESTEAKTAAQRAEEQSRKTQQDCGEQVASVKKDLIPFIDEARSKHPGLPISAALQELLMDVREVKESTKPVELTVVGYEGKQEGSGYTVRIRLAPTKDAPVGEVRFRADLGTTTTARITDLRCESSSYTSQAQITPDGKVATINFTPFDTVFVLRIILSRNADFSLVGNRLRQPLHWTKDRFGGFHPLTKGFSPVGHS